MALLELQDVSINFGRLQAVSNLSFQVDRGEIHGLIGPNGAGKTTAFNLMTGVYKPSGGKIFLDQEDITGLPPHLVASKGLTRSFQQTLIFVRETVLENVLIGFHMRHRSGKLHEFLHTGKARRAEKESVAQAMEILGLMGLSDASHEIAGNLPHGHQKALGVSMALACQPKVLLLDEPVTGMNPSETKDMIERILAIRAEGPTIVLVEHSMQVVMSVCDRITVMNYGRGIAEGPPDEIKCEQCVIEAYLGCEEE
jgi:branched-chain amino acid transport system ATP-binding protein